MNIDSENNIAVKDKENELMSKCDNSSTIEIEIEIKTKDDFDPEDDGVISVEFGTVYRINGEEREEIGEITGYVYSDYFDDLLVLADIHSQEHFDIMNSVSFKKKKGDKKTYVSGEVAIIDHVFINSEHQGKGYGTKAMEKFLTYLSIECSLDYALLIAHPLRSCLPNNRDDRGLNDKQLKENELFIEEKKKQLSRFYKQLGFVHTGNANENCMVKNLQE